MSDATSGLNGRIAGSGFVGGFGTCVHARSKSRKRDLRANCWEHVTGGLHCLANPLPFREAAVDAVRARLDQARADADDCKMLSRAPNLHTTRHVAAESAEVCCKPSKQKPRKREGHWRSPSMPVPQAALNIPELQPHMSNSLFLCSLCTFVCMSTLCAVGLSSQEPRPWSLFVSSARAPLRRTRAWKGLQFPARPAMASLPYPTLFCSLPLALVLSLCLSPSLCLPPKLFQWIPCCMVAPCSASSVFLCRLRPSICWPCGA